MRPLWSPEVEARIRKEARSLDPQTTPKDVRFCKRCVVSNQRPRIVFDDEGICSACQFAEHKKSGIDWQAREGELHALLARHKRHGSEYDVIVPASGGKDSSTVAHILKHEYGMKPLCVKWAPFLYTDIGRKNWENLSLAGFDTLEVRPNGHLHRKLARLCFEYLGDPFQPFVFGQLALPMNIAERLGVRLVFYGENGEAEYGGDPAANDRPCWSQADWRRVYLKGTGFDLVIKIGQEIGALTTDEIREFGEFYHLPDFSATHPQPEFHWLSYYRPWHPQGNYYYAADNVGFEANPEGRSEGTYSKYASLDDKMDGLHYYMAYVKFGIGRATSDAAHEVRDGDLTREEAKGLVKRFDGEFPGLHYRECLRYMGLTENQFDRVVERFRSAHLWEKPEGNPWQLKHTVWQ